MEGEGWEGVGEGWGGRVKGGRERNGRVKPQYLMWAGKHRVLHSVVQWFVSNGDGNYTHTHTHNLPSTSLPPPT